MNKKKSKYKVTFLLDKSNCWIEKQLIKFDFKYYNKFSFKISKNEKKVKNQDLVFPISYTKLLSEKFLKINKNVLIAHPSKLPNDKGFSPVQNQILKNSNKIYITLIRAVKQVDAGPICLQASFKLDGTELSKEIRQKQGDAVLKIIKKCLKKYPNLNFKKQVGKGNFNRRRYPNDAKLNPRKKLIELFNQIRVNDNELYPSFFIHKGFRYIIKVYKKKK